MRASRSFIGADYFAYALRLRRIKTIEYNRISAMVGLVESHLLAV